MNKKQKRKSKWAFENIDWNQFYNSEILSVLNLNKVPCAANSCKKNCTDNLFCLNKIGEEKWLQFAKAKAEDKNDDTDTHLNFAAGLKNYGSTCYLNSLLQVYFNISKLRAATFNFPIEDIPDEIMTYLQTIFAQMQLSLDKCVDPVELITALELPQLEQQDAPEFHSLFMNLLDARLQTIADSVIYDTFSGQLSYCTRCKECNYTSQIFCEFREIDLKPLSSVDLAMADFLKTELLTGDNKYHCTSCNNRCVGERNTRLKKLPPLLCLQLLRYSYDNYGNKKKNSANIGFPSILSMEKYLTGDKKDGEQLRYVLKAILIHIGTEPTRGHYQTVIHTNKDEWIFYDDVNVQKLANVEDVQKTLGTKKTLNKGENSKKKEQQQKDSACINFVSSNAYMLFYELSDIFHENHESQLPITVPQNLSVEINRSNEQYLTELESRKAKEDEKQRDLESRSQLVLQCLDELRFCAKDLLVEDGDMSLMERLRGEHDLQFLSCDWLTSWLEAEHTSASSQWEAEQAGARTPLAVALCPRHPGRLGPLGSVGTHFRAVKATGVMLLHQSGFLPSTSSSPTVGLTELCEPCWRLQFELKRFELQATQHGPFIDQALRKAAQSVASNGGESQLANGQQQFWVSKSHARQWRKIVREMIQRRFSDSGGPGHDSTALVLEEDNAEDEEEDDDENDASSSQKSAVIVFNSDLLCGHGVLSLDRTKRLLLSHEVWEQLRQYLRQFLLPTTDTTGYHEFPYVENESDGCQKCLLQSSELTAKAEHEKSELDFLLLTKRRFDYDAKGRILSCSPMKSSASNEVGSSPHNDSLDQSSLTCVWFVPTLFIIQWRRFIKNPSLDTMVTEIDYSDVFCEHGSTLFSSWPELLEEDSLFGVWPAEWTRLVACYSELNWQSLCAALSRPVTASECGDDMCSHGHYYCLSEELHDVPGRPGRCTECHELWTEQQTSFSNADIFVRLLEAPCESGEGPVETADLPQPPAADKKKKVKTVKRKKVEVTAPQDIQKLLEADPGQYTVVRRSNRSKRQRTDATLRVSSTDTLKDMKLQLMHIFSASPMDQHLLFHERELTDLDQSLVSIGIRPASLLHLLLDTPVNGSGTLGFEICSTSALETGFVGTKLLQSSNR